MIYPWLLPGVRYLTQLQNAQHLPHALLFTGQDGLGMEDLALYWSSCLFCQTQNEPCGKCAGCALFLAKNHPDFLWIKPEAKESIKVDEIRQVVDFVILIPGCSQHKVILISDADRMNLSAANALLKVLEEPPPASKLILVSSDPHRLPATIKSRCHFLRISPPSAEEGLLWLKQESDVSIEACKDALALTHHRPLKALVWLKENKTAQKNQFLEELLEWKRGQKSPMECSDSLSKQPFSEAIDWLYLLVLDIVRLHLIPSPRLYHQDTLDLVRQIKEHSATAVHVWMEYLDRLLDLKRHVTAGVRFNQTLLWDRIILGWPR